MPGFTTCTENIGNALDFAFRRKNKNLRPTLFSIFCQNSNGFPGFKTGGGSENHSAYPSEHEYLLREGQMVVVLYVRDFDIVNHHNSYKKLNGKNNPNLKTL